MSNVSDFVIEKSKLRKYTGSSRNVVVPEGVIGIGRWAFTRPSRLTQIILPKSLRYIDDAAFADCSSLTQITLPDGVGGAIGNFAFSGCKKLAQINLPEGVTSIGEYAFQSCSSLTQINLPESLETIKGNAFKGCANLTQITLPQNLKRIYDDVFYGCTKLTEIQIPLNVLQGWRFFETKKTMLLTILRPNQAPRRVVAVFRKSPTFLDVPVHNYAKDYLVPLDEDAIPHYDRLVASGSYDGFSANQELRVRAALWRLDDKEFPVADEMRGAFAELLTSKITTAIKFANEDQAPSYIQTLVDIGAVNKDNLAQVQRAVSKSPVPEIQAMMDKLVPTQVSDEIQARVNEKKAAKQAELTAKQLDESCAAERSVLKQLKVEELTEKQLEGKLKKLYSVTLLELPEILRKDGEGASPYVLAWLLTAHGEEVEIWGEMERADAPGIRLEAAKILAELDPKSVQSALGELAEHHLGNLGRSRRNFLAFPICRYGDNDLMAELCKRAPKWRSSMSGADAPPFRAFLNACCYSDTPAAVRFLETYGNLGRYAGLRGVSVESLTSARLAEEGMDTTGKAIYDLGSRVITVTLNPDLTLSLYDDAGKEIKSIPKRGADPEKYEKAKQGFAQLKKTVKDSAKKRKDLLFQEFLHGIRKTAENWKADYLEDPILNAVAQRVVWAQDGKTFILTGKGAIDSAGAAYAITDSPIAVAHPIEMKATEVTAWQRHFTAHKLKQPFVQIWEPAIDPQTIREDRYVGCTIPINFTRGGERHGIHFFDVNYHNELYFTTDDCEIENERTEFHRHFLAPNETFTLGKVRFKTYTRKVNHIIATFDRWTFRDRIIKDDPSIVDQLDKFTLPQIMDFIKAAQENNAPTVLTLLLEYKNTHYADFDPMEEFTLD